MRLRLEVVDRRAEYPKNIVDLSVNKNVRWSEEDRASFVEQFGYILASAYDTAWYHNTCLVVCGE